EPAQYVDLRFTLDGKKLFHNSGTLQLLEVSTGQLLHEWPGSRSGTLAVSPDGKHVAIGGRGVSIHEMTTGKVVRALHGHREQVTAAAFSPDGKRLLTAGDD